MFRSDSHDIVGNGLRPIPNGWAPPHSEVLTERHKGVRYRFMERRRGHSLQVLPSNNYFLT